MKGLLATRRSALPYLSRRLYTLIILIIMVCSFLLQTRRRQSQSRK